MKLGLSRFLQGCILLVGGFLGSLSAWFFLSLENVILSVRGIILNNDWRIGQTDEEIDLLNEMFRSGEIMSPSMFLSTISNVYGNLIQFLFALIGVMGVLGFLYIRSISRSEAREMIINEFDTDSVKYKISETLEGSDVYAVMSNFIEKIEPDINQKIGDLKKQIKILSEKIAEKDSPDDDDMDNTELELSTNDGQIERKS